MTLREAQPRAFTEWSISRAFREFQNSKAKSFAILTSWRATIDGKPVPAEVNNANWSRFKGEAEGYTYTRYGNPTVSVFEARMAQRYRT